MKRGLVLLIFLCLYQLDIQAQRHIKGVKGFEVLGGITGKGYQGQVGFIKYFSNKVYGKCNVAFESGKLVDSYKNSVGTSGFILDITAAYTVYNLNDNLFINPIFGISAATESVQKTDFTPSTTSFIYGGFGGLELEFFLTDEFVIVVNGTQRYYLNSNLGTARFFTNIGLKYCF